MFLTARKAAKDLISILPIDHDGLLNLESQSLPEKYSLVQLLETLALNDEQQSKEDRLANLLILTSCLSLLSRLARSSSDPEAITNLSLWISKSILPDETFVLNKDGAQTLSSKQRGHALFLAKQAGSLGLLSLNLLQSLKSSPSQPLDNAILLSVLAFTNERDRWTTAFACDQALVFLSHHESQIHSISFLVTYLLQSVIRPLFSKSSPSTITSSGRKAMPSTAPPKHHDFTAEETSKPWKYEAPYSFTVLGFCVENASTDIMKEHWSLYIPPLLTLLDDTSTYARSCGLSIMSTFLPRLPPKVLVHSGLDSVFEEAITPSLMWLPNLTPLEESLEILPKAYRALGVLCDVRYPLPTTSSSISLSSNSKEILKVDEKEKEEENKLKKERLKFLDRVMREGVFSAYIHSSEIPDIVEILVEQMSILISKMGVHSVKHLKDVLPILSAILTDPFATSHERLLLEAVKTIQAVVLNGWPRMSEERHRNEIIKAVVVCWKTVTEALAEKKDDERRKKIEESKGAIGVAGRLLVKAVESEIDMKKEMAPLMSIDGEMIEEVFGITARASESKE